MDPQKLVRIYFYDKKAVKFLFYFYEKKVVRMLN
jgi:hypothetical protein